MSKYDILYLISRANDFKITGLNTYENDSDERGDYYQDHNVDSYKLRDELKTAVYECFEIMRRRDEMKRQLDNALSAQKSAENKYKELEQKIAKFKEL